MKACDVFDLHDPVFDVVNKSIAVPDEVDLSLQPSHPRSTCCHRQVKQSWILDASTRHKVGPEHGEHAELSN